MRAHDVKCRIDRQAPTLSARFDDNQVNWGTRCDEMTTMLTHDRGTLMWIASLCRFGSPNAP